MDAEQKPFACGIDSCGMSFTNEDHLNVHKKKHDMVLNFGFNPAKNTTFLADQTPTPTRLIRNCDEVGLFDDIAVNPFEETFRRAVESNDDNVDQSRSSLNPLSLTGDETLHTPHVMYFNPTSAAEDEDRQTPVSTAMKTSVQHSSGFDTNVGGKCDNLNNSDADMLLYLSKSEEVQLLKDAHDDRAPKLISATHVVSQSSSTVTRASVIYVPQVTSVVQPVSGVIYEIAPKKFKSILPIPQSHNSPQMVHQKRSNETTSPKIYPKIEKETIKNSTRNLVKEKLKEALLKNGKGSSLESSSTYNQQSSSNAASRNSTMIPDWSIAGTKNELKPAEKSSPQKSLGATDQQKKMTNSDGRDKNSVQNDKLYEKNRAAAAAKRYRIKFKNEHNNLKRKNAHLETENERLRSELRAVKTILLAHQDCSITRTMAMGNVYSLGHLNDPEIETTNQQSTIKLVKPSMHNEDPPVFVILAKDNDNS